MKCELCHENDAETAIPTMRDGAEDELYVCKACAKRERVRRQKKSQSTRRVTEVTEEDMDPPAVISGLIDAVHGVVSEINRAMKQKLEDGEQKPSDEEKMEVLPCGRAERAYRIGGRLHLEGLLLIGELEPVKRAMRALGMRLDGITADGVKDAGHVYEVRYTGSAERAKRVVEDLLAQERNARKRLLGDLTLVFADSVCRALAMLKNCRLLSPGEMFDLLSPLRLASMDRLLDGITQAEIMKMLESIELDSSEDGMSPGERDEMDGRRANAMNARFEEVTLNERAERKGFWS